MDKSLSPEVLKVLQSLVLPLELKINSLLDAVRSLEEKLDEKNATQSATKEGKPKILSGDKSVGPRQKYTGSATDSRTPTMSRRVDPNPLQTRTRKQRALAATSAADREQPMLPLSAALAQKQVLRQSESPLTPSCSNAENVKETDDAQLLTRDEPTEPEVSALNSHQWRYVRGRQRKLPIRGSGDIDSQLATVEKTRQIHLWSIRNDVTAEQVASYMAKKCSTGAPYTVEKLKLRHTNYASFVIKVPESLFDFFMVANNWPPNAELNEWFRRRASKRDGDGNEPLSQSNS